MIKYRIFISHAAVDYNLAKLLKELLKTHLSLEPEEDIFVSSEGTMSIDRPDTSQIVDAHRQADAVIAMMTPESVFRTWVVFETGGAVLNKGLQTLLVVCANGLTPKSLPAPIKHWHAGYLKDLSCIQHVVQLLGRTLRCTYNEPNETSAKTLMKEAEKGLKQWEFVDMILVAERIGQSPFTLEYLLEKAEKQILSCCQNGRFLIEESDKYPQRIFDWLRVDTKRKFQILLCDRKKKACVKAWNSLFGDKQYQKHLDESTKTFRRWINDPENERFINKTEERKSQFQIRVTDLVPVGIVFIDPEEDFGRLICKTGYLQT